MRKQCRRCGADSGFGPGKRAAEQAGTRIRRSLYRLAPLLAASLVFQRVHADNFSRVYYDAGRDQLVVTMAYRGTNPNHEFALKWGKCRDAQPGSPSEVVAEVLDDQWQDQAKRDFAKTTHFDLTGMPCRPAQVTLRTAPRFHYTLLIPG